MSAKIITFEGIDGAGKSTLIQALYWHYKQKLAVWSTREPFFLNTVHSDPLTATMELIADRRAHCAAMQGDSAFDLILVDRFDLSTEAYQGYGDGIDRNLIQQLNELATEGIDVARRIWLDLPVGIAIIRTINRGDIVTDDDESRLKHVYEGYVEMEEEGRLIRIDATQPPDAVLADAIKLIDEVLSQ